MKKVECFISSLISTIQTHNGWWIDAHDYLEVGSIVIDNKEWQILVCKKCGHVSKAFQIIK